MSDGFKPLRQTLDPLFTELERRMQATLDLTARVRATLQGPERDHVISAAFQDDTLIVHADSAAWCAQIRYAQQTLLAALNGSGETQFTKLKVRVAPAP